MSISSERRGVTYHLLVVGLVTWQASTTAPRARAQHADIQVQRDVEGQLITGEVNLTTFPVTSTFPQRVFERGFGPQFVSNNPGFNAGGNASLPPGALALPTDANLGFSMPAFYLVGHGPVNLAFWDGFGDVEFGPAPAAHMLTVDGPVPNPDPSAIGVVDGSAGSVPGYDFAQTDARGSLHVHQAFTLTVDAAVAEGIYLWSLELTMADLKPSLPVYFLHETPGILAPVTSLDEAVAWTVEHLDLLDTLLGDVNDDRLVNGLDVDPFVNVLLSSRFDVAADMNGDGAVNGLDVDPFVVAVVGGTEAIPEPSTLALVLIGLAAVIGRRRFV